MNENSKLGISVLALIVGMFLLAYGSAPLYNLFCKVTGVGGAIRAQVKGADKVGKKIITVRFDANSDKNLQWDFKPMQTSIDVRTGENAIVFYEAKNNSDHDIIGTAVYNVTPYKAAQFFLKIQCFCFQEQLLKSGQKISMPVSFYIDPEIENEPSLQDIDTITLSYSFYKVKEK